MTAQRSQVDPIRLEVFRNAVTGIADEMAITIIRTAHSQIVAESMDFSTALADGDGRLLAQGNCTPMHMGSVPEAMEQLIARLGDDMRSGDVFVFNDPDEGGMHLPDVFVVRPVFHDDVRVAFTVAIAHQSDIGGRVPGGNAVDSREIFEEGLQIPILRLERDGVRNETLLRILRKNVRNPEVVLGDIEAEVAACAGGARQLEQLVRQHGIERFNALVEELMDYSEALVRSRLAALPNATTAFVDWLDDDGMGSAPVPLHVRVTIADDEAHFDFTGSADQVRSALNCTGAFTKSASFAALQAALGGDIPANSGLYRAVRFTLPERSIVNGRRPAARAARGLVGYRLVDAIWGAMSEILPDTIPAAGDGGPNNLTLGVTHADGSQSIIVDALFGAWGGGFGRDGLDGASHLAGNLSNSPVEELEQSGIVEVREFAYVPDTGGAGRWRGGLSIAREIRLLSPGILQVRSDRREHRPYGLAGGEPGAPCLNILDPGPGERLLPSKVVIELAPGQIHRHVTAGGGGYGSPLARDPQRVLDDVLDGKVTAAAAARDYGVVIGPDLAVDESATRARRAVDGGAHATPLTLDKGTR
ncbi:hydantoinase B/oxoprolinase family protein [Conexibacter sp. CPCC 206217]|uniref:hydantoinase B/oxoprolinase family protein n=1 Tax=Conexibacter sp. CPCC 206217 TaxID=3064574 RepID=UPI00271E0E69|nr:hydantoinase B/oxoprolinase family protein [Conexibacter sp. CPCC 206217]MDO8208802.1 hydantoinase B/oxoprolinase family protein [Conexibacter sp. CPCC 206217]